MELVVLDLETTGLYPAHGDRIVEVGAARYADGALVAEFESLVNPRMPISPGASRVNGLTDEMVAHAPVIEEVLPSLLEFVGPETIIAHNADFDLAFLSAACADVGHAPVRNASVCTLKLARSTIPWLSRYSLDHLVEVLRLDAVVRHRALGDVRATWALLGALLAAAGASTQITESELIALQYGRPVEPRAADSATAEWIELPPDLPNRLREAIREGRPIELIYEKSGGERSRRTITPISAYAAGPYTYLVAYCHLRGDQRTFRVDRIVSIR
jgi:DNA polymerase III epsilon subunit family exonuclease